MRFATTPDANSAARETFFFALYPPFEIAKAIADLSSRMFAAGELTGSRMRRERLHVSLNNLSGGPLPSSSILAKACNAASQVRAPSFVLALNQAVSFESKTNPKPRVLVGDEGVIGVIMLHGAIHEALARAGLMRRAERKFTPHLTLSREDGMRPDQMIEPISWRAHDFCLIAASPGARHEVLDRWPLQGCRSLHQAPLKETAACV